MRKDAFVPTHPFVVEVMKHAPEGMGHTEVSHESGLTKDFLYRLDKRGPQSGVHAASAIKIANFLRIEPQILLDKIPNTPETLPQQMATNAPAQRIERHRTPDIPILGLAAGSIVGSFQLLPTVLGYVARPPALEHVEDAYALYVENESMVPMFNPGGLIFAHPHKPTRKDDAVVIQVMGEGGKIQSFIKILVRRGAEWVVARQLNPEAEIKFAASTVVAVHKVPDLAELFNA